MASIIRIKRSSVSGNPNVLGAGELAYSALTDNGSNGGDRLYIGIGSETSGNAANHYVIGGKFFTDRLDHSAGVLTANSAIVVDADSKIDNLFVDNIQLNGNTLSTTNTNGDLYITPNGTGKTVITNPYVGDISTTLAEYIQDITGGQIVDSSEIDATYDDTAGTTSLALKTTTVTSGSYGSTTKIPTFTVDSKGRLTAAGEADVATTLSLFGDTGTGSIDLLTEFLGIFGGEGIDVNVVSSPTAITISAEDATTSNKGVASFETADFNVTSGAVELKDTVVKGLTVDASASVTPSGHSVAIVGGEGIDVTASGATITVAGEDASTSNKGVASFDSGDFSVTSGAVSIKSGGVGNAQLENSSLTIGSTTVSLGGTSTSLAGLTELSVDNLNINGNEIQSTNSNGDIVINPNGTGDVDVSGAHITNLAEPVNPTDAATKNYVDNAVSGLDWKTAVNLLADSNVSLTGSTSTLVIDGHAALDVTDNNAYRILLTGQTTSSENGIYTYTDNGTSYTLVRSTDADSYDELVTASVWVLEGVTYASTGWTQSNHYITNFSNQNWVQFSGAGAYLAGAGLGQSGTEFFVKVATSGGIEIVSDELQLKSTLAGGGLTYDTGGVLNVNGTTGRITINSDSIDISSTYVGQTSITTLGTIATGIWNGNTISEAYGGTGITSYSTGDLLYGNSFGKLSKLTAGAEGQVLQVNASGVPVWGDIDGGTY